MAVDRAHVGEAQLFKNSPELGHREALHALLEGLELGGQLPVQEGEIADRFLGVVLNELHRLTQPHPVQVGGEGANRRADRHVVVVQNHQQIGARQVAGVVDRLQGHASGEGSIADHRDAFEMLLTGITGQGHPQGSRDARGSVPRAEMVEAALAAFEITGHTTLLAKGVKIGVAAGDQLVGIGLVSHIPDHAVVVEVESLIEGQGEFHHPKPWAEVAAAGGHHLQVAFPDLASHRFQFRDGEAMQLVGVAQRAELHAF